METKRFDHLVRNMLTAHAAVVRHYNSIRTSIPLFRRAAYRFAARLLEIQKKHHNEFLDYVRTHGVDVDTWTNQHFDPIEQLGDDRRNLLRCIEEGMTEKDYIRDFKLWGPKKRRAERQPVAHVDGEAAKAATTDMSDVERAEYFKTLCEAQASEIKQLRKDLAVAIDECDQLKKDFGRLERIVEARKRKTA